MVYKYNPFIGNLDNVGVAIIPPAVPTQFNADSGSAVPVANILNLFGTAAQGISTSASGNTVTFTASDATTTQKGVSRLATNAESIAGTISTNVVIIPSSLSAKLGTQTAKAIPYGAGSTSAIAWTSALTDGQIVIGSTAGNPAAGVITSLDGSIVVSLGSNTIDLSTSGTSATQFDTDSGTAIPLAGVIEIHGGVGCSTSGSGNTVTIDLNATVPLSFPTNSGTAIPAANALTISGTGSITTSGAAATVTIALTGLTNHSLLVGAGTATITNLGVATNGQLPIGSTGADPVLATLTAGTGVSITNGAGSISIASVGGGTTWVDVTGTTQAISTGTGYLSNNAGAVTFTLPASSTVGDYFRIAGVQGSWVLAQNANQRVLYGASATTIGVGGTITTTNSGDCMEFVATNTSASSVWRGISSIGNFTVV